MTWSRTNLEVIGPPSLDISAEFHPHQVALLRLTGPLDLRSAAEMKRSLAAAVEAGYRRLVIDLEAVTFVDSSGLGALIGGLKAARGVGGDLRIARPPDQARMILRLTTLDRVLRLYSTVEEALTGL